MTVTTTKNGISVYENRPGCPARFHDSYSAAAKGGCTCPKARRDKTRYLKAHRWGIAEPAYLDPTGTRRRLQALVAIGYSTRSINSELGLSGSIGRLMWGTRRVHRETARRVSDLYERLSGTPGPSAMSRRAAVKAGYAPPHAWYGIDINDPGACPDLGGDGQDIVDVEAIRQALAGRLPFGKLRPVEKTALFRDHAGGWPVTQLAERLRMSTSSVARWRGKAGELAEVAA